MTTKNINAYFNMDTGHWVIRDNGEIILEGQGVFSYGDAIIELRKTATKKVKDHTVGHSYLAVKEAEREYLEVEETLYYYCPARRDATEQEVQQYNRVEEIMDILPHSEKKLIFDYALEADVSPNETIKHATLLRLLKKYDINPDDFIIWYYTDTYFN